MVVGDAPCRAMRPLGVAQKIAAALPGIGYRRWYRVSHWPCSRIVGKRFGASWTHASDCMAQSTENVGETTLHISA